MFHFSLFQVFAADCTDDILLELQKYLPKYYGIWSPPTAPNGNLFFKIHLLVLIHENCFLKDLSKIKPRIIKTEYMCFSYYSFSYSLRKLINILLFITSFLNSIYKLMTNFLNNWMNIYICVYIYIYTH